MAVEKNRYKQQGIGEATRAGASIYIAVYGNWVTLPSPLEGKQHPTSTPTSDQFTVQAPSGTESPYIWPLFVSDLNILLKTKKIQV